MQPDTIVPGAANPQAFNRYSYTLNNPLRYTDPSGHMVQNEVDGGCAKRSACVPYIPPPLHPELPKRPPSIEDDEEQDGVSPDPNSVSAPCDPPGDLVCQLDAGGYEPIGGFTISFKPWEDIDKVDLAVDIFGIIGDFALIIPGYGPIIWVVSTIPEVLTVGKAWDDLETGSSPSGILIDVGATVLESTKLIPAAGFFGNLMSIGTNVLEIKP